MTKDDITHAAHRRCSLIIRGGSRNFGKGGPVKGRSPEPSAEGASAGGGLGGLPQKILKD